MARRMRELLWQLSEDTTDEISQLGHGDAIDAWLDNQAALTAAYADDLEAVVHLLEQELTARGFSVRTH